MRFTVRARVVTLAAVLELAAQIAGHAALRADAADPAQASIAYVEPLHGLRGLGLSAGELDRTGCTGRFDDLEHIRFPYLLRIPSEHVLIVHGRQMPDSVTLTWQIGDSLRIDGVAIYPNPPVAPRVFSEEELEWSHKGIPFVAQRVKEGASWHEAVKDYYRHQAEMERAAADLYRATIDSTGSRELASGKVLESLDRSLLSPASEPKISGGTLVVVWDSDPLVPQEWIDLEPAAPREVAVTWNPKLLDMEAKARARDIIMRMEPQNHTPALYIVSCVATLSLGGQRATEGIRQVEFAKRGLVSRGPLSDNTLKDVVRAYVGE